MSVKIQKCITFSSSVIVFCIASYLIIDSDFTYNTYNQLDSNQKKYFINTCLCDGGLGIINIYYSLYLIYYAIICCWNDNESVINYNCYNAIFIILLFGSFVWLIYNHYILKVYINNNFKIANYILTIYFMCAIVFNLGCKIYRYRLNKTNKYKIYENNI